MITDETERKMALDPTHSFIVQAPAGSGKTELLTQRFLVLLSTVRKPEEILAITFTKKSAAEMRTRIVHALQKASLEPEPLLSHAKQTYLLAKKVLQRDLKLQWNLLNNPNRLRIQTMDSFNAFLTKQLPILSTFGSTPEISEDYESLYEEAVNEFLSHLEENVSWSDDIAILLMHLDNDLNKVAELLINMLRKRDQWLPYVTLNTHHPHLRKNLEKYLYSVNLELLSNLHDAFPKEYSAELIVLANVAALNLKRELSNSPIVFCAELTALPDKKNKKAWMGLAELLMNKEYQFRKRVDKNIGFPAPSSFKHPKEKQFAENNKERFLSLLDNLRENEKLKEAFSAFLEAPRENYSDDQWKILHALHQVLLVAVAQLKVVFQRHGKIDYIESAEAALRALGDEDAPTDLTLSLDYQIQHILIDEFQDTSHNQYRFIQRMTAGFQKGDNRTLFVVGDPMQSIYRFREADVGLFIKAREEGIGNIRLKSLRLSQNFRSTPRVVNWINEHFVHVFPEDENILSGAVSYSHSVASTDKETEGSYVKLHAFQPDESEKIAESIADLILDIKSKNEAKSIAILVRSRSHLVSIIPALKKKNIAYRAIDIDPLNTRPVIQDLISLTRALMHPADRIAWLSILRAPWIGLSLQDLWVISHHSTYTNLWEHLQKLPLQKLSVGGQKNLSRVLPILQKQMKDRKRLSLREWVEKTWILIGGPATTHDISDLEDANAYFQLLDKYGEWISPDKLYQYVSQLFATSDTNADDSLQIMTIHNSKGLEFDAVIIPHLEKKSPSDDKQLLLWMERPNQELILAPIHGTHEEKDSIYQYVKQQHAMKADYESGRLLYVAATRAKSALHLFFTIPEENRDPQTSSLLHKLMPSIKHQLQCQKAPDISLKEVAAAAKYNFRLKENWENPVKEVEEKFAFHQKNEGFLLRNQDAKNIGIVIHLILQKIAECGFEWWSQLHQENYIHYHLSQRVLHSALQNTKTIVLNAIDQTLKDSRGQWILHPHLDAKSELPITTHHENEVHMLVIDRTFVDTDGIRWIIDFKTSHPENISIDEFLHSEKNKYEEKMHLYSRAFQALDNRIIKMGLYFPLIPAWIEW